jgi:hypothetical protein
MGVAAIDQSKGVEQFELDLLRRFVPIVELTSEVDVREGVSKDGKAYKRVNQIGFVSRLVRGRECQEQIQVGLDARNPIPFRPGLYVFGMDAWEVNGYSELGLRRFEKPMQYVGPAPTDGDG